MSGQPGAWGTPGRARVGEVPFPDSGNHGVEEGLPSTDFSLPGQHEGFVPGALAEGELSAGAHGARISKRRSTARAHPAPHSLPAAVLKAEQAAVFKFPLAPLGCSGLGSALLAVLPRRDSRGPPA